MYTPPKSSPGGTGPSSMSWVPKLDGERGIGAFARVGDEQRIEIDGRQTNDRLGHNRRAEGVCAPDLEHVLLAFQHLRHELVAGEDERETLGIVEQHLARHQAETGDSPLAPAVEQFLILRFSCGWHWCVHIKAGQTCRREWCGRERPSGARRRLRGRYTAISAPAAPARRSSARRFDSTLPSSHSSRSGRPAP